MMDEKQEEEKTTPDNIIKMIIETGGMMGLRTGAEQVKTYVSNVNYFVRFASIILAGFLIV